MAFELAPRYWIWKAEGFKAPHARKVFGGFLAHLVGSLSAPQRSLPDMAALMEQIEQLAPVCGSPDRVPMLALYWAYHAFVCKEGRRQEWQQFLSGFEDDLGKCSIEWLACWSLLCDKLPPWPAAACGAAFEEYQRRRYNPSAVKIPLLIEVAIMAAIANLYLEAGDRDAFARWVDQAILDAAGHKPVQEMLVESKASCSVIDIRRLIGLSPVPDKAGEAASGQPSGGEAADSRPVEPVAPTQPSASHS
jgi:hypothetical protein